MSMAPERIWVLYLDPRKDAEPMVFEEGREEGDSVEYVRADLYDELWSEFENSAPPDMVAQYKQRIEALEALAERQVKRTGELTGQVDRLLRTQITPELRERVKRALEATWITTTHQELFRDILAATEETDR